MGGALFPPPFPFPLSQRRGTAAAAAAVGCSVGSSSSPLAAAAAAALLPYSQGLAQVTDRPVVPLTASQSHTALRVSLSPFSLPIRVPSLSLP